MKKALCLFFLSIFLSSDPGDARIKENAIVSAFVYPANGRLIPLVGFPNASIEMRVQIPAAGIDQTFRGTTDPRGHVVLGRFYLDPAWSPTSVIYSVNASYMSPSNGLVQGIYYSADFTFSQAARVTTLGEYSLGMMVPVTAQ